ncbi:hypothetical protein BT96DRAFT_941613 [Gymnopus androsaceus JB14]|uniref:Uncharacterized protein n=1 Tax=Gymnopus androsaceus JB14 TaxID=1447944 RepID=A0A6A4HDP9_9AGAR|nr:hypothetical protein BT96DRAFT_941613 [Gymnopus androsaceus JB14]
MDETILQELYRIYFEQYPTQAVTNEELGDTRGFSAEAIADTRWFKEKLVIERTKEGLKEWLSTMEGVTDLDTIAQAMPKLDVVPALDFDLQEWAIKVANFIHHPPCSAEDPNDMVFKPLLSDAYSMTFHHTMQGEDQCIYDHENGKGKESNIAADLQGERSSRRVRFKAYHGEPETLREQRTRKLEELAS